MTSTNVDKESTPETNEDPRRPFVTFKNGDVFIYTKPCSSISVTNIAEDYPYWWIKVAFDSGEVEYHAVENVHQWGLNIPEEDDDDLDADDD